MKKALIIFYFVGNILLPGLEARSQDSSDMSKSDTTIVNIQDSLKAFEAEFDSLFPPKKSHIKVEIGYLSNNVYFGRKDSVATPYITGQLGYYHKSGLYTNVTASYLPTAGQNRFDLFTVEAGYNHRFGDLEMQLAGSKFFYNSNSYNVESEIQETLAAAFAYDWKVITPVVAGTVIFSNLATDYAASFGIEHSFYMANNKLEITASMAANASTQNYYNSYYQLRKYKRLEKLLASLGIKEQIDADIADAEKFKFLDYEFSLPINYSIKKFTVNVTPVYAIPVNPATISFTAKLPNQTITRTYREKLNNSVFFQAGIAYKF